jgi:hypothetical protein
LFDIWAKESDLRLVDRFLVILVGLVLIGVVTVLMLVPEAVITALQSIQAANLFLRLALVVVVNIVILVLLYLRLRGRHRLSNGLAVKAAGAFTDVSVESARTLILNAVNAVPDVAAADATVKAVQGQADIDLNIQVSGRDVHIPQKQKEINRALGQVINKQLGLRMRGKPRVHITLEGEKPVLALEEKKPSSQSVTQIDDPRIDPAPKADELPAAAASNKINAATVSADDEVESGHQDADTISKSTTVNDDWLDNQMSNSPGKDLRE